MPSLTEYLTSIGSETHDASYVDDTGTIRIITKDERLAREVWKRALGYEENVDNGNGSMTHRVYPPDARAQTFIFERREGKVVTAPEPDRTGNLLDNVSDVARHNANSMARKAVDDSDNPTT